MSCYLGFLAASPVRASVENLPAALLPDNMDGYKS
jgi:hypothetical protein